MSSLTVSLLLLAVAAILVVVGYNLWIGRRSGAAAPPAAGATRSEGARAEPSLDGTEGPSGAQLREEAEAGEGGEGGDRWALPAGARAAAVAVLDDRTDCIVEVALPTAVPGERLIALARGLRRAGSKPILLEASTAPLDAAEADADAPPVVWQPPAAGASYHAARIGILLANRHGPLNAMEFSEFVAKVQAVAEPLSVLADTPDMAGVLARARELDETCAGLDAQVGIGVESPDPLSVADLARLASECGCVERGNNRYARLGDGGEVLFSLALSDAPNRLTLLLDVPRAPADHRPWRALVACAQLCAQRLGGAVVDDAGRPLPEVQLARIEQRIDEQCRLLDEAGIPAGSALALRLFN